MTALVVGLTGAGVAEAGPWNGGGHGGLARGNTPSAVASGRHGGGPDRAHVQGSTTRKARAGSAKGSTNGRRLGSAKGPARSSSLGPETASGTPTVRPDGSCSGAQCTPTQLGRHLVTGIASIGGFTWFRPPVILPIVPPFVPPLDPPVVPPVDPPTFAPGAQQVTGVALDASSRTTEAGRSVTYAVKGLDEHGVPFVDLTRDAVLTMTAPGSCTGSSCTAARAQTYTVTGTVRLPEGTFSGMATLDVLPGPAVTFDLDPGVAIATAGSRVSYRAVGVDALGNRLGTVTASAITIGPDGSCAATVCSAAHVGPHTITAIARLGRGTVAARADLLVLSTDIVTLRLNPRAAQIRPGQKVTYSAMGLDSTGRAITDLTAYTSLSIGGDGSCTTDTCTATALGPHTVTGTVHTAKGTVDGAAALEVTPSGSSGGSAGELAGIELSPRTAQVDAGARMTYIATGLDAKGTPVGDLTGQATFTIAPDGSCDGATCIATSPGPHTVTGTVNGVAGPVGERSVSGVAVSRAVAFREPARPVAVAPFTASAELSVTAGPGSCLVRPENLTTLTATTHDLSGGASVRVDGSFDQRFATCAVVVLIDGDPLADQTLIGADGTIVAAGSVAAASGGADGTVVVLAPDGIPLKRVAFRIPATAAPNWPLLILLVLAFLAVATLASAERDRRQRRWIAQHVRVTPVTVEGTLVAGHEQDATRSHSVHRVPRADSGAIDLTQEPER